MPCLTLLAVLLASAAGPALPPATSNVVLSKRVYGYLPYWVRVDLTTLRWDLLSDVIAFSADVGMDGNVGNPYALPDPALVQAAHAHGVKVHLSATLFNTLQAPNAILIFLGDPAAQVRAQQQLIALAHGIDGLNLDFEFVPSAATSAFTSFVQQIHAALRAAVPGAELTISMPSQPGHPGYDTAALQAASDRLFLMEYDYAVRDSPSAGPGAPLSKGALWPLDIESALDGYLALTPPASLVLGVPYYGNEWPTASSAPGAAVTADGIAILFRDGFGKLASFGRQWESASQTPWYTYAAGGQTFQGWIEDGESLSLKYALANRKGLAGVMIWALGYDAGRTEAWDALFGAFGTLQPPPPPGAPGELHLLSAQLSPSSVGAGQMATAVLHVQNVGGQTIPAADPPPETVYDEPQSSTGSVEGTWRLALDVQDRPAAQPDHPWRWGLGQPLAAGADLTVQVQVRLEKTGSRTLWAAVVHEDAGVTQDHVGQATIAVAEAVDAGTSDAGSQSTGTHASSGQGCAQTQSSPALWAVALALLACRLRATARGS